MIPSESNSQRRRTWVVIPALNEEHSIGLVLSELSDDVRVFVTDNGSTDRTAEVAASLGANVVREGRRGYGQACLTALAEVRRCHPAPSDWVVFLDADYSDDPTELPALLAPLASDRADIVIGSRVLGHRQPGAMLPQARFGNLLATTWIWWLTGVEFTDLGPFRAITWEALENLHMQDRAFGWTVEMQLKAAAQGLRCSEVPVSYRPRRGTSKITGTVRGTVLAGATIIGILARYSLPRRGGLWHGGANRPPIA